MRLISFLAASALVALLPACASVTRGTSQAFVVESDPVGADVTFTEVIKTDKNGKAQKPQQKFSPASCKTPCSVKVKRKPGFIVKVSKEGYETVEANITSAISGGGGAGMAGNLLAGGLIGAVVDGSNGSMNELKPNPLKIAMIKIQPPVPADTAAGASAAPVAAVADPAAAVTPVTAPSGAAPAAPVTAPAEAAPAAPVTAPLPK